MRVLVCFALLISTSFASAFPFKNAYDMRKAILFVKGAQGWRKLWYTKACTGAVVLAHDQRYFVTAAHCLSDDDDTFYAAEGAFAKNSMVQNSVAEAELHVKDGFSIASSTCSFFH